MKPIKDGIVFRLTHLRNKGLSYKEIARTLSIGVGTSHKYAKNVRVSPAGTLRLKRKLKRKQNLFKHCYAVPKKIKITHKLTLGKVRIIAHCLFDGSVIKGDYVIKYTNASRGLIKQFINDMRGVYGVTPSDIFLNNGKNHPWWEVRFHSKKVVEDLLRYSKSYSTSDDVGLPKGVSRKREFICAFLRAFWEDEGCIDLEGDLTALSKSQRLIDKIGALHRRLRITYSSYKSGVCHVLHVKKTFENYCNFQEMIGFGESIIARGKFIGLKKNTVLSDFISTHRFRKQSNWDNDKYT